MKGHRSALHSSTLHFREGRVCTSANYIWPSSATSALTPHFKRFMERSRKRSESPFNNHSNLIIAVTLRDTASSFSVHLRCSPLVRVCAGCKFAQSLHEITQSQHAIKMLTSRHAGYKTKYLVFTF